MHLEICVEDASGKLFLDGILPRIIRRDVTWKVHGYAGIGHIPKGLRSTDNAAQRIFLDNLPKLIRGCANTPYVTALFIVVDTDSRNCGDFLRDLKGVQQAIAPESNVIFRLAVEEMEAWILGDPDALRAAFAKVNEVALQSYVQDAVCGTWEVLADVVYPGGSSALIAEGWPAPGRAKCGWAEAVTPHMSFTNNASPSFQKLLQALQPFA